MSSPISITEEVNIKNNLKIQNSLNQFNNQSSSIKDLSNFTDKQQWILKTRLKFCNRPEFAITATMLHEDGQLNQDYFRPRFEDLLKRHKASIEGGNSIDNQFNKVWGEEQKLELIRGIQELGIGKFREIAERFLPGWSGNELRLKTCRLIGRQNLQLYKGWKGDAIAIQKEYEYNKGLGMKYGTWKNSVLVYDDEGKVSKELERRRNF